MNKMLAAKFKKMRIQNGFSTYELSRRINISESKIINWENADESPEIEELVSLSKLYGIAVDELLNAESSSPISLSKDSYVKDSKSQFDKQSKEISFSENSNNYQSVYKNDYKTSPQSTNNDIGQQIGEGFAVVGKEIGKGINIVSREITKEIAKYNDNKKAQIQNTNCNKNNNSGTFLFGLPYSVLITLIFIASGMFLNLWHPAWMLFLTIPIFYSIVKVGKTGNCRHFCYPVFITFLFLALGFLIHAWSWSWILFLTIPVFYLSKNKNVNN